MNRQTDGIELPTVPAYADDLILIAKEETEKTHFVETTEYLINDHAHYVKSSILERESSDIDILKTEKMYKLGNRELTTTNKMFIHY